MNEIGMHQEKAVIPQTKEEQDLETKEFYEKLENSLKENAEKVEKASTLTEES